MRQVEYPHNTIRHLNIKNSFCNASARTNTNIEELKILIDVNLALNETISN